MVPVVLLPAVITSGCGFMDWSPRNERSTDSGAVIDYLDRWLDIRLDDDGLDLEAESWDTSGRDLNVDVRLWFAGEQDRVENFANVALGSPLRKGGGRTLMVSPAGPCGHTENVSHTLLPAQFFEVGFTAERVMDCAAHSFARYGDALSGESSVTVLLNPVVDGRASGLIYAYYFTM